MRRKGFTLVEMLVVIGIIGVLAAMLVPAVMRAQSAARSLQCTSNLRQLSIGVASYHDVYNRFPVNAHQMGNFAWSPLVRILPFVEEAAIAATLDLTQPVPSYLPDDLQMRRISLFICPEQPRAYGTHVFHDLGTTGVTEIEFATHYGVSGGPHFSMGFTQITNEAPPPTDEACVQFWMQR